MRDIQMVLERWGAWVANNHEDVEWSSVAAGFKGLIPSKVKSRPQCSDDDGLIISSAMTVLKKKEPYNWGYHLIRLLSDCRKLKGLLTVVWQCWGYL